MPTKKQVQDIFARYAARLNRTIEASATLCWDLYSARVISDDTLSTVTTPGRDSPSANNELLKGVMRAIEADPEVFETFLSVLEGHASLSKIAVKMREDLQVLSDLPSNNTSSRPVYPSLQAQSSSPNTIEEMTRLQRLLDEQKRELLVNKQEIESLRQQRAELQATNARLQATNAHLREELEETQRELLATKKRLGLEAKVSRTIAKPEMMMSYKTGYHENYGCTSSQESTMTESSLDEDDLQRVVAELDRVVDIQGLGLALGVRMHALQKIREDEHSLEKQKIKIVHHWLTRKDIVRDKQREVPRWSGLADAVTKENPVLGQQIRDKHC